MKRKFLALAICVTTVLSIVGCGSDSKKVEVETTTKVESSTNETKKDNTIETPTNEEEETSSNVSTNNSEEFLAYFPETIKMDNSKLVTINNSMKMGSDVISIKLTTGSKDENSYISFSMKDAFDFKILTQSNDCYAYIDMYSYLKESMTSDELKSLKEAYAEEMNVDVSTVTDEILDEFLRKETLLSGYTDLSLDEDNEKFDESAIETLQSSYLDMEQLDELLSSYNKSQLIYDTIENGVVKATYRINGYDFPIEIGVDETTKELVFFAFSYESEGIVCDTTITLSDFNLDEIDTSWISKESESSIEDVYEMFYTILMMMSMGQIQ